MSLKQAVEDELKAPDRRARCGVALTRDALPPSDATEFDELIAGTTFASVISKALRREGFTLPQNTITRHRNRNCNCGAR